MPSTTTWVPSYPNNNPPICSGFMQYTLFPLISTSTSPICHILAQSAIFHGLQKHSAEFLCISPWPVQTGLHFHQSQDLSRRELHLNLQQRLFQLHRVFLLLVRFKAMIWCLFETTKTKTEDLAWVPVHLFRYRCQSRWAFSQFDSRSNPSSWPCVAIVKNAL